MNEIDCFRFEQQCRFKALGGSDFTVAMSLGSAVKHVVDNPCLQLQLEEPEYVYCDATPCDLALPVIDMKAKRAKEFVDIIPGMPGISLGLCQTSLAAVLDRDLTEEELALDSEKAMWTLVDHALRLKAFSKLPAPLQPKSGLPEGTVMGISLVKEAGGRWTVVKTFYNREPMTVGTIKGICIDTPKVWDYKRCTNSDTFRKAVVHMLLGSGGHHWLYLVTRPKLQGQGQDGAEIDGNPGSKGKKWNVSAEQLKSGIAYINFKAPLTNCMNEQFLWILLNLRDENSPIFGWPMTVVCKAAANRTNSKSQVSIIDFFPLLISDVNHILAGEILPKVVPHLLTHACVLLGMPGRGKTPLAIILGMALSRHIIEQSMSDLTAGVRKCKQIDGLKDCPGEKHVPVIIDDPNLDSIHVEDIKSLLTVAEERVVDCRYHPLKLAAGQPTFLISNNFKDQSEPQKNSFSETITWAEFSSMLGDVFNTSVMTHVMAILKRSVVMIAGKNGVYVRMPGEDKGVPVQAFWTQHLVDDWLADEHKEFYGKLKKGQKLRYPGREEI